jgi:hypothetical protein
MAPFVPSWGLTRGSIINTPLAARDFVMNVVPDADRFQHRVLKDDAIGGKYAQSLYDNLAAGSEMLYRFCLLSDAYDKVSRSHEDLASKVEKFIEDRVKILQEKLELCERLNSQDLELNNMKVQLALEDSLKHRIEVCEAELSKAHDDLSKCQELLAKAEASELGKKVKELEVCVFPFIQLPFFKALLPFSFFSPCLSLYC